MLVAIGGAWRQSAAVGGRTPPSREPSGIFERHPPVYAVGLLQRDRGGLARRLHPRPEKRKTPQRAHTAGRHDRTGTLARDRVFGGHKKERATRPLCGSGCPLGCVVDGVEAVDTPPYSRAGEGCGRPVGEVPFYPASPRGRFLESAQASLFSRAASLLFHMGNGRV